MHAAPNHPFFTVFIPAYNCQSTLPRLLLSIERQTFIDFECVIVDDGSTDATSAIARNWSARTSIDCRVYSQPNGGKHVARNRALKFARGVMFFTVDSDDELLPQCLDVLHKTWTSIPAGEQTYFAGVEARMADRTTGKPQSESLPEGVLDATYAEIVHVMGFAGDRTRFIRTDVFRNFRFPVYAEETFLTEAIVWNRISLAGYRFRYINDVLVAVDYLPTGLSRRSYLVRARNPIGALSYYGEFLHLVVPSFSVQESLAWRVQCNWFRYSRHARNRHKSGSLPRMGPLFLASSWTMGQVLYVLDIVRIYLRERRATVRS